MSWWKRFTRPAATNDVTRRATPLGLAPGRMLCLDPALKTLLEGHSDVIVPADEKICVVGSIDLGQSMRIERYYLDDGDYFLQLVMHGAGEDDIQDIILFGYHDLAVLNSRQELLRLTGPDARIGLPEYEHDGYRFLRQWGTEAGQTELAPMTERVSSAGGDYLVQHLCMLYARDTGLINRREFLLFSVEEDPQGAVSLSTAVGVTLQSTDIRIL